MKLVKHVEQSVKLPYCQRIHFDVFSTVHSIHFRFDSVFDDWYVFDENLLSVSVWTEGLNVSKCMHFQTKTH